jgi:rare lipoprotein A
MRTRTTTATILLALGAALAICSPVLAATSPGGSAAPTPSASPTTIHTTGIATWFGPGFYGQETACGQTLTPTVIGVANRTLPCGTLVKVTYKGHSVTVPVLDRGPYSHGADWDLTAGAAEALGVSETVRIGTRIVGKAPNTATLGLAPTPPGATTTATAAGGAVAG